MKRKKFKPRVLLSREGFWLYVIDNKREYLQLMQIWIGTHDLGEL